MMTSKAISPKESLPIGAPSNVQTGSPAPVIYREFAAPRPVPLADTVSLESLIARCAVDAPLSAEMSEARRQLAGSLYADAPASLSALRLEAGLSQAQLAERVETSQPHIARIERGVTDPGTETIARIARALEVDEVVIFRAVRRQLSTKGA